MTFTELLQRIESGTTTVDDATWLRDKLSDLLQISVNRGDVLGYAPDIDSDYASYLEELDAYASQRQ